MGDHLLTLQVPQGVLELHELDEEVVFGIEFRRALRALEVEGKPLLNPMHVGALGQVQEQGQVQAEGSRQDAVAAEKVQLDLHGISQPPEDIHVVPSLLVVSTRRVVVDAHLVVIVPVEFRVEAGLQDLIQHRELGLLLALE